MVVPSSQIVLLLLNHLTHTIFTVTEAGTFYYDAHIGSLNMEGSAGIIVVYDEESNTYPIQTRSKFDDFNYDDELRIILFDLYHMPVNTQIALVEHHPFEWNIDSLLINCKGE